MKVPNTNEEEPFLLTGRELLNNNQLHTSNEKVDEKPIILRIYPVFRDYGEQTNQFVKGTRILVAIVYV